MQGPWGFPGAQNTDRWDGAGETSTALAPSGVQGTRGPGRACRSPAWLHGAKTQTETRPRPPTVPGVGIPTHAHVLHAQYTHAPHMLTGSVRSVLASTWAHPSPRPEHRYRTSAHRCAHSLQLGFDSPLFLTPVHMHMPTTGGAEGVRGFLTLMSSPTYCWACGRLCFPDPVSDSHAVGAEAGGGGGVGVALPPESGVGSFFHVTVFSRRQGCDSSVQWGP